MQTVCSALAFWSSGEVLAEVDHLPIVAFPFLLLYPCVPHRSKVFLSVHPQSHGPNQSHQTQQQQPRDDDVAAFEAAMLAVCHWQSGFLQAFPAPPIPLLSRLAEALTKRDPELARHLGRVRA